jgi:PAS domain S-box-containing protein
MLALLASEISSVDLERHYLRKDGTEFWGHLACRRFKDVHGNELGLIGVISDISERKRAEDALRKSEKMLHTIIDAEPECVKLLDENSCLIMMNRAGLDMLEADSLEQVKGQCVCPMITSDYRQEFMDLNKRVFQGESGSLLFEMVGMKGRHLWLETHAAPLRNEKDEIIALLGITRDVTERKRAEEELREKENRYRTLFEAANDGIFIQGSTGFMDCNRRGAEMYGLPKEKLIGRQPAEFAPERQPDGRLSAEVAAEKTRAALNGVPQIFTWQPLRADGSLFDVEITLSRLDLGGEVLLQAIVRDITERKRAEAALRQSENRFRSIIENSSVGILVADVESRKSRYANPEICRMLGYSEEEILALRATDLTIPEEQPMSVAGFRAHADGKLNVTERTLRRKDGSTIRMSINSVRMEFDGLPCLVGFFTDITQKQLLEEERLKAQKLESLGTLAGGIAHDFNNLLQGIFGYISMAKLTIDQREKSLAMLEQAEKALHQSVNLTSQLLTFSKGGKPVKKVVDLRQVIENSVKFALSGSRVSYDLSFRDDRCMVEADEGQIGQVVQNIVMNAEQSMPLGGRIEIAVRNVPHARAAGLYLTAVDGLVEIMVRDRGMGIPPEHLPRIFDPYFTTKEKGSGLGLATSYSIVRNHDGMIDVSSELGKGSTFMIYLPAACTAQEQAVASVAGYATGRTCRVLVMDDEPIVRVVAGELLRELGHDAEFAEHGDSAIEKYRRAMAENRPFDVVILDLTIRGGMGGLDTLRKLKEMDPGVKAVVSSGYSDDEVVATYQQHGFRSFLKKPYDMRELCRILDDVMA